MVIDKFSLASVLYGFSDYGLLDLGQPIHTDIWCKLFAHLKVANMGNILTDVCMHAILEIW